MSALDRYQLHDLLGQGGMGAVYRARDDSNNETVAIKLLHSSTPKARERMLREIRALAALNHRGIVRVRDAGTHQGSPFVVLDFVKGETLDTRVAREGPLPNYAAAELSRDLADALEHAHRKGVVHRDVKPDNVLLDTAGRPRLTDFGLSTQAGDEQQRLTMSGALLGTPGFLSPEQAEGKRDAIGPLTDVYGLGAVLYFALTGHPPIQGTSLPQVIAATCHTRPTPPYEHNPAADRQLSKICLRCLEKDPAQRYSSAQELSNALERVLSGDSRSGPSVWVWLVLAAIGVLAVGGGWALGKLNSSDAPPAAGPAEQTRPTPPVSPPTPEPAHEEPEQDLSAVRQLCDRAAELLMAERAAEAKRLAEEATSLDPDSARAWFYRGLGTMTAGDTSEALRYLERALELAPDRPSVLLNLGVCLSGLERYEEALTFFDRAIEGQDSARGRIQRAVVLRKLGRMELGMRDVARSLELDPLPMDLINAVTCSREANAKAVHARAMELLSRCELTLGSERYARAEILAQDYPEVTLRDTAWLLERTPNDPGARVFRARALLDLGQLQQALDTLGPLDQPTAKFGPAALEIRAIAGYFLGRPQLTADAWERMARSGVESSVSKAYAALALIELRRLDEAEALYAEQLASPNPDPVPLALRAVLHNARGMHAEAIHDASVATERGVIQPWLHCSLADSLEHLGRNAEALTLWRQIVRAPKLAPQLRELAKQRIAEAETRGD